MAYANRRREHFYRLKHYIICFRGSCWKNVLVIIVGCAKEGVHHGAFPYGAVTNQPIHFYHHRDLSATEKESTCFRQLSQWAWQQLHHQDAVRLRVLLLLGGDIESNPGPMTKEQEALLNKVLDIVPTLQAGQNNIIQEVRDLKVKQSGTEESLNALTIRVNQLENDLPATKSAGVNSSVSSANLMESAAAEISRLRTHCDDAESRAHRANLLFFGFRDTERETWVQSENAVLDVCLERLG
ncbi:uncharacterized protein ISCGN_000466 [Ixodes scapularis]